MARSYGKLLAGVWLDPDWLALRKDDQRLYMTLLSQPRLTLIGLLDYKPQRWKVTAVDETIDELEEAIRGLEVAAFVVVDRDTEELLIRSFARYDGVNPKNGKLVGGLWGAWSAVASPILRKVAVDNMPDVYWGEHAPKAADDLRRSPRIHCPIAHLLDRPIGQVSDPAIGSPSTCNRNLPPIAESDLRPDRTITPELIEQAKTGLAAARSVLAPGGLS